MLSLVRLKTLVASFLCLVSLLADAQTIFPRAGVALSNMSLDSPFPTTEMKWGTSFTFGLGVELDLAKKIDLLVECNYLNRNYRIYNDMPFGTGGRSLGDVVYEHHNIDIPFQAKRYFGNAPVKFYVTAGGYIDIGLGGTKKGRITYYSSAGNVFMDLDGEIAYGKSPNFSDDLYYHYFDSRIDAGLVAGVGVLLFKVALVDVRYQHGFVNISEESKNRSFQIAVSVPLKLANTKSL
jgi:hypothetical protein